MQAFSLPCVLRASPKEHFFEGTNCEALHYEDVSNARFGAVPSVLTQFQVLREVA
jgi:hypothetical protein